MQIHAPVLESRILHTHNSDPTRQLNLHWCLSLNCHIISILAPSLSLHQFSFSFRGTLDLFENRISRVGVNLQISAWLNVLYAIRCAGRTRTHIMYDTNNKRGNHLDKFELSPPILPSLRTVIPPSCDKLWKMSVYAPVIFGTSRIFTRARPCYSALCHRVFARSTPSSSFPSYSGVIFPTDPECEFHAYCRENQRTLALQNSKASENPRGNLSSYFQRLLLWKSFSILILPASSGSHCIPSIFASLRAYFRTCCPSRGFLFHSEQ